MRIVEHIPYELIVDIKPVFEIGGREHRVAQSLATLRLNVLYGVFKNRFLNVIADDKKIDPTVEILQKHAGNNNELQAPDPLKKLGDFILLERGGTEQKTLKCSEILEFFIESPAAYPPPPCDKMPMVFPDQFPVHFFFLDNSYLPQKCEFAPRSGRVYFRPARHLGIVVHVVRIKKKQPQHFHPRLTAEEFPEDFHAPILAQTPQAVARGVCK